MPAPAVIQRPAWLGLKAAAWFAFLAPLLTRLVIGQAFFLTGRGKLEHLENTVNYFRELQVPMPELNAAFVSRLEYYGGALLIAGLFTRLVAAGLGSTMIVALLTADKGNFLKALFGEGDAGLTDIVPVVYGMFLAWLLLYGPGLLSLDTLIARWIGPPPESDTPGS